MGQRAVDEADVCGVDVGAVDVDAVDAGAIEDVERLVGVVEVADASFFEPPEHALSPPAAVAIPTAAARNRVTDDGRGRMTATLNQSDRVKIDRRFGFTEGPIAVTMMGRGRRRGDSRSTESE